MYRALIHDNNALLLRSKHALRIMTPARSGIRVQRRQWRLVPAFELSLVLIAQNLSGRNVLGQAGELAGPSGVFRVESFVFS